MAWGRGVVVNKTMTGVGIIIGLHRYGNKINCTSSNYIILNDTRMVLLK